MTPPPLTTDMSNTCSFQRQMLLCLYLVSMKYITLSQGKRAIVDDEDYEWLNQWKWYADNVRGGRTYAANKNRKKMYMHRLILGSADKHSDHINGDGLDNRRENLRLCDRSQNASNRRGSEGKSSKYKGVHWRPPCGREITGNWISQITKNKIRYYLGKFKTQKDAAIAYDKAARFIHGEFASLNDV